MSAAPRVTVLSAVLVIGGCATAGLEDHDIRSPVVLAETGMVAAAARDEFRLDGIPLLRYERDRRVSSEPFDPQVIWRRDEVPARIECRDRDGQPLAPDGRVTMRVSATTYEQGTASAPEVWHPGEPLRQNLPLTRIELRSSGYLARAGSTDRVRCTLSTSYARALLQRIANRFPQADTTRRITVR